MDRGPDRLVVVGASLAGLRAVETARRRGFTGDIVLVGAEHHAPYDRPPLSKAALTTGADLSPPLRDERSLRSELGVDVRLGAAATALDTVDKVVVAAGEEIRYDALVVATGATAPDPFWCGRRGRCAHAQDRRGRRLRSTGA